MDHATIVIEESIAPSTAVRWTIQSMVGVTSRDMEKLGWRQKDKLVMKRPENPERYLEGLRRNGIIAKVIPPGEWEILHTFLNLVQRWGDMRAKAIKFREEVLKPLVLDHGSHIMEKGVDARALNIEGWQLSVIGGEYEQQCVLSDICDGCGSERLEDGVCTLCGEMKTAFQNFTLTSPLTEMPPHTPLGEFPSLKACANPYCDELLLPEDMSDGFCPRCFRERVVGNLRSH